MNRLDGDRYPDVFEIIYDGYKEDDKSSVIDIRHVCWTKKVRIVFAYDSIDVGWLCDIKGLVKMGRSYYINKCVLFPKLKALGGTMLCVLSILNLFVVGNIFSGEIISDDEIIAVYDMRKEGI